MRHVLLLDAQDLATLRTGSPMLIQTGAGVVEVRYETPRLAKPVESVDGQPAPYGKPKPSIPLRKCPYCQKEYVSVRSHISAKHPGKGLLATGGVKCRWCAKRYPSKNSAFRHEVRGHPEQFKKEAQA
jgi:uncharacterized Zn-finger protein